MLPVLPQVPATTSAATLPLLGMPLAALADALQSRTRALAALRALHEVSATPPPSAVPEVLAGVGAAAWREARVQFHVPAWRVVNRQVATDGTQKFAIAFGAGARDDQAVETVWIPGDGRETVCVSSQAGCTRACKFCATAELGFGRNLTADEIVLQYLIAAHHAPRAPRNVVFMGMGEPMDNLDNVLAAIAVLTGTPSPSLRAEHITVSTSGIGTGMVRFLRDSRASFALSLNGTTDEQRGRIMPQTKKWPLAELMAIMRADAAAHPWRRYFMEYVMLAGHNDSDADADRLPALLAGLPAHLNLIPHNAFPGSTLTPSAPAVVTRFRDRLHAHGLRAIIRTPRGRDIAAACGQLARGHSRTPEIV
ncbi:MAG: 23S rRNA (adenine(2503)-C(2))-methyltransferase RlmN [Myxococcales bacterium]|nr:23S rRNA (adenine(2503)-C(2))-methyltransferase RlmN [Myxococcales bacterium]